MVYGRFRKRRPTKYRRWSTRNRAYKSRVYKRRRFYKKKKARFTKRSARRTPGSTAIIYTPPWKITTFNLYKKFVWEKQLEWTWTWPFAGHCLQYVIRGNSPYDPAYVTAADPSAMGWAEYTDIYRCYSCLGSKIRVLGQVGPTNDQLGFMCTPITFGVQSGRNPGIYDYGPLMQLEDITCHPDCKYTRVYNTFDKSTKTVSNYNPTTRLCDKQNRYNAATMDDNPPNNQLWYWTVFAAIPEWPSVGTRPTGTFISLRTTIRVTFYTRLMDPYVPINE